MVIQTLYQALQLVYPWESVSDPIYQGEAYGDSQPHVISQTAYGDNQPYVISQTAGNDIVTSLSGCG